MRRGDYGPGSIINERAQKIATMRIEREGKEIIGTDQIVRLLS